MYAIVSNGSVVRLLRPDEAFSLNNKQYPAGWLRAVDAAAREAIGVYPVTEDVAPDARFYTFGQGTPTYDGVSKTVHLPLVTVARDLARAKDALLASLASRRFAAETGGTTYLGAPIATDLSSQAKYAGAALAAKLAKDASQTFSLNWKTDAGQWLSLDADAIIAIAQAARAHIQACYDNEKTISDQITAAADIAALQAIDIEAGWPA